MALREFWAGVRAQLPILVGVVPFGAIYGALAIGAGLPVAAAQAMSALVFAGSSQFVATGLFAAAAPWPVIVLTTLIINLRHVWYSASVAPYLAHLPLRWKLALAYLLTDEAYVVAIQRYARPVAEPDQRHFYFRHWPSALGGLADLDRHRGVCRCTGSTSVEPRLCPPLDLHRPAGNGN